MTPISSLPAAVTVSGEPWHLYSVRFEYDGATYVTYLYARSWAEARGMLDALRETGEVDGEVQGWVDGDAPMAAVDALVRDMNEPGGAS